MKKFSKEIQLAILAAKKAGALVLKEQATAPILTAKAGAEHFDFTTAADLASEELIIGMIRNAYPDDGILSEETLSNAETTSGRRMWIIDPIDGTRNYSHGLKIYAVAISLYADGHIQLAAVYLPALDDLYTAVRGEGVFLNDKKLLVRNPEQELKKSLVAVGFHHQRTEAQMSKTFSIMQKIVDLSADVMRSGSAVYDTCMLAAGSIGGYISSPDAKPWDIAAGILFIEEQGGVITGFDGRPANLFSKVGNSYSISVLAAKNKSIHEALLPYLI